jgi:hypothetical protein
LLRKSRMGQKTTLLSCSFSLKSGRLSDYLGQCFYIFICFFFYFWRLKQQRRNNNET